MLSPIVKGAIKIMSQNMDILFPKVIFPLPSFILHWKGDDAQRHPEKQASHQADIKPYGTLPASKASGGCASP